MCVCVCDGEVWGGVLSVCVKAEGRGRGGGGKRYRIILI